MVTTSIVRPAVWIGCMECYNNAYLVGEWFDAEDAGEVTPKDIHDGKPTTHEELWCFDIEGFPPNTGEMSPREASKWGEIFTEIGKEEWGAYLAFAESGISSAGPTEEDAIDEFRDHYHGTWASFSDYLAEELIRYKRIGQKRQNATLIGMPTSVTPNLTTSSPAPQTETHTYSQPTNHPTQYPDHPLGGQGISF